MLFADSLEMVTRKLNNCMWFIDIHADEKQQSNRSRKHTEMPCMGCAIQMLDDRERLNNILCWCWICTTQTCCKKIIWEITAINACKIKLFTKSELETSSILLCSDIYTAAFKRIDHKWLAENIIYMYLTRSGFYDPHFVNYQLKCLKAMQ